jgi:hypothetical protein
MDVVLVFVLKAGRQIALKHTVKFVRDARKEITLGKLLFGKSQMHTVSRRSA